MMMCVGCLLMCILSVCGFLFCVISCGNVVLVIFIRFGMVVLMCVCVVVRFVMLSSLICVVIIGLLVLVWKLLFLCIRCVVLEVAVIIDGFFIIIGISMLLLLM